eukprot:gene10254-biopygen10811
MSRINKAHAVDSVCGVACVSGEGETAPRNAASQGGVFGWWLDNQGTGPNTNTCAASEQVSAAAVNIWQRHERHSGNQYKWCPSMSTAIQVRGNKTSAQGL